MYRITYLFIKNFEAKIILNWLPVSFLDES